MLISFDKSIELSNCFGLSKMFLLLLFKWKGCGDVSFHGKPTCILPISLYALEVVHSNVEGEGSD